MTRSTALEAQHIALGARLTDFAGWNMPLWYEGALDEHHAVRNAAGLFDLSHMGEIEVRGPDAAAALDYALVGNLGAIAVGRAKYSMICNADGMIIDDLVTYRRADDRYMVVANASNYEVVAAELTARAEGFDVQVEDQSLDTALIAIQGPNSEAIVVALTEPAMAEVGYYCGAESTSVAGPTYVARTGYTGEDGFELYVPTDQAVVLWEAAVAAGADAGLVPCGLACRDTLRLEAGMALYGNELSLETTPYDAGAGGLISFKKDSDFVGRAALEALREAPHASLVGLEVQGKRPARAHYAVVDPETGDQIGELTSGTLSPTLDKLIAMARLNPGIDPEAPLAVDVRGKTTPAAVVPLPFYKRDK